MTPCPPSAVGARCADPKLTTVDLRASHADDVARWCLESMRSMLERQLPDGVKPAVLRLYDAAAKHVRFEVSTLYASEVGDEA